MRNDCCKTHVKTFKDGAEYYAQRQNKAPGRKYVVSWMTKTVRIVNVQVKGTLERREMRNDDQETHTRRQTRRRNASTRLAR